VGARREQQAGDQARQPGDDALHPGCGKGASEQEQADEGVKGIAGPGGEQRRHLFTAFECGSGRWAQSLLHAGDVVAGGQQRVAQGGRLLAGGCRYRVRLLGPAGRRGPSG